ncbi:MAG: methyltransferase domain-containing protein [Bdellovibrionales bacterium]|nr:methyltransferase domain-containing protein [Bdellovibrionales bacterium]
MDCPLCDCKDKVTIYKYQQKFRDELFPRHYWLCGLCGLVYLDKSCFVSREFEKCRYEEHENDLSCDGYRQFLLQFWEPFRGLLQQSDVGLDFGAGPGPAIRQLAAEEGIQMVPYDPYFVPHDSVLKKKYDFVVATEVVEHFNRPQQSWKMLFQLAKEAAPVGIMTDPYEEGMDLSKWGYLLDLTHVVFYQTKTLNWIAHQYGKTLVTLNRRSFVFVSR